MIYAGCTHGGVTFDRGTPSYRPSLDRLEREGYRGSTLPRLSKSKHSMDEEVRLVRQLIEGVDYEVVWSGRDSLLPEREEHHDERIDLMPSYDLDDGQSKDTRPRRKYTRTGKHVGEFRRAATEDAYDGDQDDRGTVEGTLEQADSYRAADF